MNQFEISSRSLDRGIYQARACEGLVRRRALPAFVVLLASMLCPARLAAQTTDPNNPPDPATATATQWATWLNGLAPQAVPQETIILGGLQFVAPGTLTGTPGENGVHLVWNGFPTVQTPPACALGGGGLVVTSVQAPVVQINSFNERYQILIAKPDNFDLHDLQVVLTVPTPGGGSEDIAGTLQDSSSAGSGTPAGQNLSRLIPKYAKPSVTPGSAGTGTPAGQEQSLFQGATLATIAFHPRTSLPQRLQIWSTSSGRSACYTIVPYLQPQLGAFVVPYVPIAVIYQPPGCGQCTTQTPQGPVVSACGSSATYGVSTQHGTTLSWENSSTSGTVKTESPQDFLGYVSQAAQFASFIAGVIPGGQAAAGAFDTMGKVVGTLQGLYTQTTKTTVTVTNSQTEARGWVITDGEDWNTNICQLGDTLVYLEDVLFVYAVVPIDPVSGNVTPNGVPTVTLAPLKWDPPRQRTFSQLPSQVPPIPPAVLAQFQALDIHLSPQKGSYGRMTHAATRITPNGPTSAITFGGGPRLVEMPDEECPAPASGAPHDVPLSEEQLSQSGTSQATTITTLASVTGLFASISGQASETTQSLTYSTDSTSWSSVTQEAALHLQCPEVAPADGGRWMHIYLDTLFDTLVAVPGPIESGTPSIAGTINSQQGPVGNRGVLLKMGGKTYRVFSDASGKYAFRIASLPKGRGVLVVGNEMRPINYNGTLLANQNFKVGPLALTTPGSRVAATGGTGLGAAAPVGQLRSPAVPAACCSITAIDARFARVAARVNSSGQAFNFSVPDAQLLNGLKVGQGVYANFKTRQVSLEGNTVAGTIVSLSPAKGPLPPGAPSKAPSASPAPQLGASPRVAGGSTPQAGPVAPTAGTSAACCGIASIDARARLAAAKVNSTGQAFKFSVPYSVPIQSLHTGQPVWANFKARKVSLDGKAACCDIVALGNTPAGPTGQPVAESAPVGPGKPGGARPQMAAYRQIDPCTIASADSLKALLQAGIQGYFPIAVDNGGEHIRITHPNVEQVICPHMVIKVHTDFGYSQTQGFPQFQTGGTMELQSSLVVNVTFSGGVVAAASAPITAANFVRAVAVLSNPQITSPQVDNIPSWIDLTFIADCLNGKYSNWGCTDVLHTMSFDVTALVKFYLDQGNTIPASSQTSLLPRQSRITAPGPAKPTPAQGPVQRGTITPTPKPVPTTGSEPSLLRNPALNAVIARIDPHTGVAVVKEKSTGRKFYVLPASPASLQSLSAGKEVQFDLAKRHVSLDGTHSIARVIPPVLAKSQIVNLGMRLSRLGSSGSPRPNQMQGRQRASTASGGTAPTQTPASALPAHANLNLNLAHASNFTFSIVNVPGSFPSQDWLIPGNTGIPFGISDEGKIVGSYPDASGAWQSYLEVGGRYANLRAPGMPFAISDSVSVVGSIFGSTSDQGYVGSLPNQFQTVKFPGPGFSMDRGEPTLSLGSVSNLNDPNGTDTYALDVNRTGNIVGEYLDSSLNSHGFLSRNGQFTTIDVPGAVDTSLSGINDKAVIVGYFDTGFFSPMHGFIYNGVFQTVDFPGAYDTYQLKINSKGLVLGHFDYAFIDDLGLPVVYEDHCFLYDGRSFSILDEPPNSAMPSCLGIDRNGRIVGATLIDEGFSQVWYGFVATPTQSTLVCSTKPEHLNKPVAQGVMVPSGAKIYCQLRLKGAWPSSPHDLVITTSDPTLAQATRPVNLSPGAFEVSTQPVRETLPLTVSASYGGRTASTTVTLVKTAIRDFRCPGLCQIPGGPLGGSVTLDVVAPADPDGLQIQLVGDNRFSGQINVAGGSDHAQALTSFNPVTVETPISYSVHDPFDGSVHTTKILVEPPAVWAIWIGDASGNPIRNRSISNVPVNGVPITVHVLFTGVPPASGISFPVQYSGSPMTGPATITYQNPNSTSALTFPATVMPCAGNPPCTETVTVGSMTPWSLDNSWTLTINP